ncbi:MAG TPA: hypothetical protein ENJ40_05125 [Thermosulfurimonas dismutans]|uniref:Endonuclease MutS2 n=2 Tax=Thermosulfurimonas TaxID=1522431 RepID=A0A7C3GSX3_9BACT|nr:hypothetical protein [Thermosulfurimonas dismutans]
MPGVLDKLEWPGLLQEIKAYLATEAGEGLVETFSPAFSFEEALARQNFFQELEDFARRTGLNRLPELPRLTPLVLRATRGGILLPEELYLILRYLETGRLLKELSFFPDLSRLEFLREELSSALEPGGRDLTDRASPELREARRRVRHYFERLHRLMEDLLRSYARAGVLQEEHIFQRKGRLVLPVRAEHKNRVPGILHDVSQSGATVFIEPAEAVPVSNELELARLEEERARQKALERLSRLVEGEAQALREVEEAVARVDLGLAALNLSRRYRGRYPRLKSSGQLRLLKAAHPFFFLRGEEPVANDFFLSPERPVLLISGPNYGGKTVATKTVGLCVLLAQAGLPIPAAEGSEIPVFREILADLGDDQGLEIHESSFSAHLRVLAGILEKAGPGTLVLLDEPGRGTDPREGGALAVAILETLEHSGALVVATTHFPEVKRYAVLSSKTLPASMAFEPQTLRPLYRLVYGLPGDSHGLTLARTFLPPEVVDRARRLYSGSEEDGRLWERLHHLEAELEKQKEGLAAERKALEEEKRKWEEKRRQLEEEYRLLREELRREVEKRLQSLSHRLQELAREYSRKGKKHVEKEWKTATREIIDGLKEPAVPGPLSPGQRVYLQDLQREGEVVRDLGEGVEVRVGNFRLALSKKGIKVLTDASEKARFQISVSSRVPVSREIHLLGLRVDEALSRLETFLNQALLAGVREVRVVHGLGTGKLMQAVRDYLDGHEAVESWRPAAPHEGGEGATMVKLVPPAGGVLHRRGS